MECYVYVADGNLWFPYEGLALETYLKTVTNKEQNFFDIVIPEHEFVKENISKILEVLKSLYESVDNLYLSIKIGDENGKRTTQSTLYDFAEIDLEQNVVYPFISEDVNELGSQLLPAVKNRAYHDSLSPSELVKYDFSNYRSVLRVGGGRREITTEVLEGVIIVTEASIETVFVVNNNTRGIQFKGTVEEVKAFLSTNPQNLDFHDYILIIVPNQEGEHIAALVNEVNHNLYQSVSTSLKGLK